MFILSVCLLCVRYRNSKLTFLLKDVLSGNCRATMIATVGPEEEFAQETLCTLNFASRVRSLKLGRVKKAMQREERTAKLRQQLQLSEARSRRQIADLNKQIANLQGQLADSQQQVHFQRKLTFASFGWSVGVSGVQLGFDRIGGIGGAARIATSQFAC